MSALQLLCSAAFLHLANGILLYPNSSVFQITFSLSVPVPELPPTRKLFFDWGLQMNYNFPFQLSAFYNAPIWPGIADDERRRREMGHHLDPNDSAVGAIYKGLKRLFVGSGLHESCLKRFVCELAEKMFFEDSDDFLNQVIMHFLSLPERKSGEAKTVLSDLTGKDCQQLYPMCG